MNRLITFSSLLLLAVNAAGADAPLADAAQKRDWRAVAALVEKKVDASAAQADGMTALHWAAYHEDVEAAKKLAGAGADVKGANRYGVTPLAIACTNGNTEIVDLLL